MAFPEKLPRTISTSDVYFSTKPYSSPYVSNGLDICDNMYVEFAASPTAKVRYNYIGIPGLHLVAPATNPSPCRGMITTGNGRVFGVWGTQFVELTVDGTVRVIRNAQAPLRTYSGIVRFRENGYTVVMVDGQDGYTFDLTSNVFAEITDQYFPGVDGNDRTKGPSHVSMVDTYFLVNSRHTNSFFWSAPGYVPYAFSIMQPGVTNLWNGLQYGQKIADTGNILAMVETGHLLWLASLNSIEVQYNAAGDSPEAARGQLFQRITNTMIPYGVAAPDTLVAMGSSIYWLGHDSKGTVGIFTCGPDYKTMRISERGFETRIESYASYTDAYAFTYAHDGHQYVQFVFPQGTSVDGGNVNGATWCYDITTATCTRRTKWVAAEGQPYKYQGEFATEAFSRLLMGDAASNAVYAFDTAQLYNDLPDGSGKQMIQSRFSGPISYINGKNVIYHRCQLNHQPGFAPQFGQGSDPKIALQVSNDAGVTFGDSVFKSMGALGQYGYRTKWDKLGISRNRVHLWTITDPVRRVINGYTLWYEVGTR